MCQAKVISFSTSDGLFTWILWLNSDIYSGLLQGGFDEPSRKGEKNKTLNVEERLMGSSPKQRAVLTSPTPCNFSISKKQVRVKKKPSSSP